MSISSSFLFGLCLLTMLSLTMATNTVIDIEEALLAFEANLSALDAKLLINESKQDIQVIRHLIKNIR